MMDGECADLTPLAPDHDILPMDPLELKDECFGVDHGPIEPGEIIQWLGRGVFDMFRFFS